jgi:F-box protein 25/32
MQRLVTQFHNSIHAAYPFYYYIGSGLLWRRHIEMLTRMQETIKQVRINMIKKKEDNNKSTFDYLPIEMQVEVIRRLDNGTDIINVGMINTNLYRVTQELLIWRQLCLYHFGDERQNNNNSVLGEKIHGLIKRQQKDVDIDNIDWKKTYFKLKRRHGLREVYAEMIHQCQLCKCLFWQVSLVGCFL